MLGTVPNVRIATLVGEGRVITVSLDAYGENIVETCGSMQHKLAAMRTNLQRSGKYMITLEENGVNRGTDTLIMPQAILNGTGLSADIETASNIIGAVYFLSMHETPNIRAQEVLFDIWPK